ncbi:hypothetical protein U9M48_024963 [Paspalum notatum var. saurae]|uniref:Uncharacterized protein n=1 Tax=Paspalum notatum var. saurae TaxID=547442 RepID=A0AAQ3WXH9_PASNO
MQSACRHRERMRCVISETGMLPMPWRFASSLFAFIVFAALLFSTSFAGRPCNFLTDQHALHRKGEATAGAKQNEPAVVPLGHARMLNVKTNDYSSYDPSPTMDKPHFKLIPN